MQHTELTFDPLGDEVGFISYVSHMGSDISVVNAARVSFNKHVEELSERDERLIKYLANHNHWSPFAHTALTVRIRAPLSVYRQWEKHTVGVNNNSESTRYVEMEPEFYLPRELRKQSKDSKQGSSGMLNYDDNQYWIEQISKAYAYAHITYTFLVRNGVAKEQARDVLPLATYTTWISTMSLAAAARIYNQRTKDGAQFEVGCYARALGEICKVLYPVSWRCLVGEHGS